MLARVILLAALAALAAAQCNPTPTRASGTHAPAEICAGALIFSDDFDTLDLKKWQHEITMSGGGNWEFQVYSNNRSNSFVEDGKLHIRPTLTADQYGEEFLHSGVLNLHGGAPAEQCTNPSFYGCERTGQGANILNPAKSARVRSVNSFSFVYGKVEFRARMPLGDWLWAALWMMPAYNAYGVWPMSGEIDISEVRCNAGLTAEGKNIGIEQTGGTLHFGPFWPLNGFERAHFDINVSPGLDADYHLYQFEWTPTYIKFSLDNREMGTIAPPAGGFWEMGGFSQQAAGIENPWRHGDLMAPFDQEFYLIMNLAVGGTNGYFPDATQNPDPKPWLNNSPQAFLDFWNARDRWLSTWNLNADNGLKASMLVDYVRVWAL